MAKRGRKQQYDLEFKSKPMKDVSAGFEDYMKENERMNKRPVRKWYLGTNDENENNGEDFNNLIEGAAGSSGD